MTFIRHNNAAGQASGTTAGTGAGTNTGGTSGYAFSSAVFGTGSTFQFSDISGPGSLPPGATACYQITANGSGNAYFQWTTPALPVLNVRDWVYFSGSVAAQRVLDWQGGGNFSQIVSVVSSAGLKWQLSGNNSAGAAITQNGTTTVSANTWYMLDVQFTAGTPGSIAAIIYAIDGTPLETITLSGTWSLWNTGFVFGFSAGVSATIYHALPALSDQGRIGTADLTALPQSKLFTADGGSVTSSLAYHADPAPFNSGGAVVTSLPVTKQATSAGDWIIIFVYSGGTTVTCPGTTFTIRQDASKNGALLYRLATGGEGTTFTLNFSGAGYAVSGIIVTISGAAGILDPLTPSSATASATQTMTATAISTANANNLCLWFGGNYDGATGYAITPPANFGTAYTTGQLTGNPAVTVASLALTASGTTGARSGICSGSATVATAMMTLCGTTQGPVVSAGNQAGSGDAFDVLANSPGSQFSTAQAIEGGTSLWFPSQKVNTWAVGNVGATWDIYLAFNVWMNAAPTVAGCLLMDTLSQAGVSTFQVLWGTNNKVTVNASTPVSSAGTSAYLVQHWYFFLTHCHVDATAGYAEMKTYDGITGAFIETIKTATTASNTGLNVMEVGALTGTTTGVYLDYIQVSDQYPPAPHGGWQPVPTPLALSGGFASSSGGAFFDFL